VVRLFGTTCWPRAWSGPDVMWLALGSFALMAARSRASRGGSAAEWLRAYLQTQNGWKEKSDYTPTGARAEMMNG